MLNAQELEGIAELRVKTVMEVRALAQHYLLPEKPTNEKELGAPEFMRKMADAAAAVEVICSIVNVFGVMTGLRHFSGDSAITDLTFVLNTNQFWLKNSSYMMPLVNSSVNAFSDNYALTEKPQPLWGALVYHNRNVWLELLPAVVFCLSGHSAMRKVSLEMKQSFEKFLRG